LDKGLISRIYRELKKLNPKESTPKWRNEQMNWIGNFQKKYRWLINTWRNTELPWP
jgi:hypothetical protein